MTIIGEEMHVSTDNLIKYYRLPVSAALETFLINSSRNSVSSIQITDQKLLQTWALTHPDYFTSPPASWAADNSVCCVVENTKLLIWDINSEDLKSAKKQKFTDAIFAVIPVKNQPPLIVFNSGSTMSVDNCQNDISKNAPYSMSAEEELIWVDASLLKTDVIVAQLTFNKKAKDYHLRSFIVKDGIIDESSFSCVLISHNALRLKGYCLNNDAKHIRFLTIWENGNVCSHSLDGSVSDVLFRVSDITINNDASVAIDVVGSSHLAVVKSQLTSKKKEGSIEIWDLNYCVVKATKPLKQELSKNLQVKTLGSSVFISSTEGVIRMLVTLEASTLLAVTAKSTAVDGQTVSWASKETSGGQMEVSENTAELIPDSKGLLSAFEQMIEKLSVKETELFCEQLLQSDISEQELVSMLKSIISNDITKLDATEDESSVTDLKGILLNAIFRVSFSDIFLRQHLNELTFPETMIILKTLLELFDSHLFSTKDSQRPTDLQIINWMQLILQVHFEELLLSSDKKVRRVLKKLQSCLIEKMDVYEELDQIKYLLMIQKKKNVMPDKSVPTNYSIESLYL